MLWQLFEKLGCDDQAMLEDMTEMAATLDRVLVPSGTDMYQSD
jgi:hypothetical protein